MVAENERKKKATPGGPLVDHAKELTKIIRQLSREYSVWRVFEDFLAMAAIEISNAVDWTNKAERETTYRETAARYNKGAIELFPAMMYHLVEALERHADAPDDILGWIFHELELHNKYKGQFFTPQEVCDCMGMISLAENDAWIAAKGHISVSEPCCGNGAMILGLAKAMARRGFDPHRQMVVTATDIDLKCVYMCYLQMSLYGIPAVVIHGDTILMREWSRWYTPVYLLDGWVWRQTCGNVNRRYPEDEAIKRACEPMYAAFRDAEALLAPRANETAEGSGETAKPVFDIKISEATNGQLSFDF